MVFPDSWARILPVELESFPDGSDAGREMVLWKLRKLLPGHPTDLVVTWEPMPALTDEKRVLVSAISRETVESIERAFEENGVRIGYLARAVVFGVIGVFFVVAAVQHDPSESKGISGSIQEIAEHSWGPAVLWIIAIGLVLFGLFCLAESKYRRAA